MNALWAAAVITRSMIAPHVEFLSHDLLEGRLPGSRGEQIATRYIAAQLASWGYETSFQKVPLVGVAPELGATVTVKAPSPVKLVVRDDLVVSAGAPIPEVRIADSEIVFVGFGIVAPEHQWNDYEGVDLTGKIALIMNNDPSSAPGLFAGETRLWYGRWDYKYLTAARHGAVGAIVIHTTPSAGYPFQVVQTSFMGEQMQLPAAGEKALLARMWATEEATRRIVQAAGKDLDALRAAAEKPGFRAVPLGVTMSLAFKNAIRRIEGENVLGLLGGRDQKLKDEVVVYTAHHDHLGVRTSIAGDAIYNGAFDNASGVALTLAMARAAAEAPRPKRSLLFLFVTAEEQGLLGSEWYCKNPTFPPGRIAANINVDTINRLGRASDVGFIGYGKSSLDRIVEAEAKAQGRRVHGDPFPDRGSFYRSDQFNFARIGVPAIYAQGGPTYPGRPPGWGKEQRELYERTHYHQPSDHWDPSWDLSGAIEDGELLLRAGLRIANDAKLPAWKPGDEFEAARKAALGR